MPNINFDFEGARNAGISDSDIKQAFKEKYNIDYDFEGAKKAGIKDEEILNSINDKYNTFKKKDQPNGTSDGSDLKNDQPTGQSQLESKQHEIKGSRIADQKEETNPYGQVKKQNILSRDIELPDEYLKPKTVKEFVERFNYEPKDEALLSNPDKILPRKEQEDLLNKKKITDTIKQNIANGNVPVDRKSVV